MPLKKSGQRIALIGPFVQDRENIEGCWTLFGDKERYVTLEQGVRAVVGTEDLSVVAGCGLEEALPGGISAAIDAAQAADVVVLALGEPQRFSGEAQSRTEITLPPAQQALAEAIAATGTPMVVLLRNGRALALSGAVRDADAIAVTWYLGTQTGTGVADVLFGDYNPSARLPISFPQVTGQQPYFYNHLRTGRPELPALSEYKARWREMPNEPLYPFGHGLSYTTFAYAQPQLSAAQLGWDETLTITTRVTNTGKVAGEEVVQLYVHDRVASRVRPVRELKGFRRCCCSPARARRWCSHWSATRWHSPTTRASSVRSRVCSIYGCARRPRAARPSASSCWNADSGALGTDSQRLSCERMTTATTRSPADAVLRRDDDCSCRHRVCRCAASATPAHAAESIRRRSRRGLALGRQLQQTSGAATGFVFQ